MAGLLFGAETEYAIAGRGRRRAIPSASAARVLLRQAGRQLTHLLDVNLATGFYLGNGARFYVDCGTHPEYCTPECANPWDLVRHIAAGHRILAGLAAGAKAAGMRSREILCFRSNVDYSHAGATWGCHESYLHKTDPSLWQQQLIPHLVTRPIYTGAGGFNPKSAGLEFTLAPRLTYFEQVVTNNSTSERGIWHCKLEPLSAGYRRLHVICGESLCSETAVFLKFGVTALIVAMADAGLGPGAAVQLAKPIVALRKVISDVSCKAPLSAADKRTLTAVAVQRHYLEMAEAHCDDDFMPRWAGDVCRLWREILDRLETGPEAVARTLDWGIKLSLYANQARSQGIRWDSLPGLAVLEEFESPLNVAEDAALHAVPGAVPGAVLDAAPQAMMARQPSRQRDASLPVPVTPARLRTLKRLRERMFEIDVRFGQLGGAGIFDALDRAGVLEHRLVADETIERAMTQPPENTRAYLRGMTVQKLAGNGNVRCDWQEVVDFKERKVLDLSDPFSLEETWRPVSPDECRRNRSRIPVEFSACFADVAYGSREPGPSAWRERAYTLYENGNYAEAEELLRGCVAEGFEVASCRCHLARVMMMMNRELEARAEIELAWTVCEGACPHVVPRILFFQCLFAMLDREDFSASIRSMKDVLRGGYAHMSWTIRPLLDHLHARLGAENFSFLKALGGFLSDASQRHPVEAFSQWSGEEAESAR